MDLFGWMDLDDSLYFSSPALGSSDVKLLYKSPAAYWWEKNGHECVKRKKTKAMDFGTAFHLLCLQPHLYEERCVVVPYFDDRRSSEAIKAKKAATDLAKTIDGGFILNFEDDYIARHMHHSIMSADEVGVLFSYENAAPEISMFAKDPSTGINLRGKVDRRINDRGMLIDVKTVRNADKDAVQRDMTDFGWDLQAAHYLHVANLIDGPGHWHTFLFVAVEKAPPFRTYIEVADPKDFLSYGFRKLEKAYRNYKNGVEQNQWPRYEPDESQIRTLNTPIWARME